MSARADMLTQLRTHLIDHEALGELVEERVYPDTVPLKAALPALSYLVVNSVPLQHRGSRKARYSTTRVQFDIWAASRDVAQVTRAALLDALGTFHTSAPVRVDVALRSNEQAAYEPDTGRYRTIVDYRVWHEEN